MQLLSELTFGAYLVYAPYGESSTSQYSKRVRTAIKKGNDKTLESVVERLAADFGQTGLSAVLGPDVILVPTPGSAPRLGHSLWVPHHIAGLLVQAGLGREVLTCLTRHTEVLKSAYQPSDKRPNAHRHFETLEVAEAQLPLSVERITLVDDFVTRGATLLGAASRLFVDTGHVPRAFALVRTMSPGEVNNLIEPCVGVIQMRGDRSYRRP